MISAASLFILIFQITLISDSHGGKGPSNCTCGEEGRGSIKVRIIGGSLLRPLSQPSLAGVTYDDELICGGSVVGPHHILTAAHCLTQIYSITMLKVVLGAYDRMAKEPFAKTFDVREIIKHKDFKIMKNNMMINDIALLKVDEIKFNEHIKPICLPFDFDTQKFKAAAVVGWGTTEYSGNSARLPRVALLSILTPKECSISPLGKPLGKVKNVYQMIICAYKFNSDACQGDSGGPLLVQDDNDVIYQIGIVSFGVKCATAGMPGLYTKLSHYMGWLADHLNGEYCSKPPAET